MAKLADPEKKKGVTDCLIAARNRPPRRAFVYRPPADCLHILHHDNHIVVVEKPAGLLSVPGKADGLSDCLESRVRARFATARMVHRLDHATSGVMVMALTAEAHRHLGLQFERRHVKKTYRAMVAGHLPARSGFVSLPIRCDWPQRPIQMVDYEHGRPSETQYEVVCENADSSNVLLYPVTGRSHQLRLHMAETGNPVLGDVFYGGDGIDGMAPRLMLHAEVLRFFHPANGERVTFDCPSGFGA